MYNVCYAPPEDAEEKDAFYDSLQKTVDEAPSYDVLLLMEDLNAKIGRDNRGNESKSIIGQHRLGEGNNNGERLSAFCKENNFVIGGTIIMHKDLHKATWNSPNGHSKNKISHVIINKRWRGSPMDVVARHGADMVSDHSFVLATIRLTFRKAKRKDQRPPPINIQSLKDPHVKTTFQTEFRNRFAVLEGR